MLFLRVALTHVKMLSRSLLADPLNSCLNLNLIEYICFQVVSRDEYSDTDESDAD